MLIRLYTSDYLWPPSVIGTKMLTLFVCLFVCFYIVGPLEDMNHWLRVGLAYLCWHYLSVLYLLCWAIRSSDRKLPINLLTYLLNIVNLSLSSRQFHSTLKQSTIFPLLKNLILIRTGSQTIVPSLIFLSHLISSNVWLNLDLLNTLLPIISLIPTSLLSLSTTSLKLLCSTYFMIILSLL